MSTTATETDAERRVERGQRGKTTLVIDEETAEAVAAATESDADKGELFDKSQYEREELALPKVDGEGVDKIAVAFSGTVLLDRADPADVELMRRMRLGNDVTLMVEAKCSGKGHRFTTDREGDLDVIVLEHKAKVHTVYKAAADEAEEAAA